MDIYDELIEKCQEHIKANDVAAAKKFIEETRALYRGMFLMLRTVSICIDHWYLAIL